MRASEIRNLLIQKYGFSPDAIARILDKKELKKLLLSEMVKVQTKDKYDYFKSTLYYVCYILVGLFLFALALRSIVSYFQELRSGKDKGMTKMKLVLRHYRKGYLLGSATLFLSVLLDILSSGMTLSTFLSWIIPLDSPFRRLLIPMFSFPLNSSMMASMATGDTHASPRGGYGIDIGPMLTIGLVNWLIHQLQEWSSGLVLEGMKQKEERKAHKKPHKEPKDPKDRSSKNRKHAREEVDIVSSFTQSMRQSRAKGFTDNPEEEEEEEFDINQINRSLSEPPVPSSSIISEESTIYHHEQISSSIEEFSSLPTNFDEIRRFNQHFARIHSKEVNNDSVVYTREDQVDICILERLASICEETPEQVALESTTPVVDIDESDSPHNPSFDSDGAKYSPLSMTREQSEAMLTNIQSVDYYNPEDAVLKVEDNDAHDGATFEESGEPAGGLSPDSREIRSIVSEDSDEEVYREALAVSGDAQDDQNTTDQ